MTSRPDFGPDYGQEQWEKPAPEPEVLEEERRELFEGERELYEHEAGEREVHYGGVEGNELHVQGQVCQRCGAPITATQEARRHLDGSWAHEICPVHHQPS
ncbi:MAG: hypothetical protein JO244_12150 [Solirubrobacterales bacterium]|nr:hypothetical protein [Solirubrobacterales bacterium]